MEPLHTSVHLEDDRKELFRIARRLLSEAMGSNTQAAQFDAQLLVRESSPDQSISLMPWLVDRSGQRALKIGINTIGRSSDNDIVVSDPTVSRRHSAILIHSDLRAEIYDIASKNGTIVNGVRIEAPVLLKHGDLIVLSEYKFVFVQRRFSEPKPITEKANISTEIL